MHSATLYRSPQVLRLIQLALEEDAPAGDVTAELTVPASVQAVAEVIARENLVVCGAELIPSIADVAGIRISVSHLEIDSARVGSGTVIARFAGASRDLLFLERTILNFMQRMSGVASYTSSIVDMAGGLTILDTRKTIPGWRALDKHAVKVGGGKNHRFSLSDMVLIKNNHIDAHPGGIRGALSNVFARKAPSLKVEVEVRNEDELKVALDFPVSVIMLDNFSDDQIGPAVSAIRAQRHSPLVEASGGITVERLARLKELGVDCVSLGRLTTRAPNSDISMRLTPQ